jgi:hypothetical protein
MPCFKLDAVAIRCFKNAYYQFTNQNNNLEMAIQNS